MDLESTRRKIDGIDSEIIKLLSRRMELAIQTGRLKKDIEDKEREKSVLAAVKAQSRGIIEPKFTNDIYSRIIEESKNLQKKRLKLIGFQGEHGAYSEVAARAFDLKAVSIPCSEFEEVFKGVAGGQLDSGIVPVENTRAGAVNEVNDLLIETDLQVIGEVRMPIHHCLLVLPETDYRDIKVVLSHPMALAQCKGFLARHKLEGRNYYDTAGAARMLSEERPKATAVVASKLCAEIYGLEMLREDIEDQSGNSTRFLILGREANKEEGDKCSIVFSTAHKAGALFSILKVFSEAQINLTRIESRPLVNDPGKFAFLLDFQGSHKDKKVAEALKNVKEHTAMYKFLGCYREAKA